MGCALSGFSHRRTPSDTPPSITQAELRLWADLIDGEQWESSAESANEPSTCFSVLQQRVITLHARVVHGITGSIDNTPDGVVYERYTNPVLHIKEIRRIELWLSRVEPPTLRDTAASFDEPLPYADDEPVHQPAHRLIVFRPDDDNECNDPLTIGALPSSYDGHDS